MNETVQKIDLPEKFDRLCTAFRCKDEECAFEVMINWQESTGNCAAVVCGAPIVICGKTGADEATIEEALSCLDGHGQAKEPWTTPAYYL